MVRDGDGYVCRAAHAGDVRLHLPRRRRLAGAGRISGMNFEFATATRIRFGAGARHEAASAAAALGKRALLVSGRRGATADALEAELRAAGVDVTRFAAGGEPTIAMVTEGVA